MADIRRWFAAGLAVAIASGLGGVAHGAGSDAEHGAGPYALEGGGVVHDRVYVWRIDRRTGRVSLCRSETSATTPSPKPDMDAEPVCTPWTD